MLIKLMKHEIKATSRLLIPLYLVLLCISIVNHFLFKSGSQEGILGFISGFLMVTQIVFIIAVLVVTILFMITRFYKNLLSDEGYLMFTLPVNTHHLILSKLIVTLFWIIISLLAILVSGCLVLTSVADISVIFQTIKTAFAELATAFNGRLGLLTVEFSLVILLSIVGNILIVYASIAVGQLFSKHKLIASFVSYVVIYNALQLIIIAIMLIVGYVTSGNILLDDASIPQLIFPLSIVLGFIQCVLFYAATHHIFSRKLNLD